MLATLTRSRVAPADRASVRRFLGRFSGLGLPALVVLGLSCLAIQLPLGWTRATLGLGRTTAALGGG